MAIRNGIFKVRNASTGEKDEVMLKTTIAQVDDLNKLTGATASAAGVWGLAPAPAKGSQNLPLCGDAKYKVLPVEGGGTGANTVAAAVKALFGSSAVGSSTKSIYYDGATLKACADSIGGGGIVAQLLEQNGYVKFANGLILQWGHKDNSTSIVTFNLSFPTTCFIALVETLNDGTVNCHLRVSGATNVGFSTWDSATNRPYSVQNYWLALGI
nr:MAG TPA: putative tail fiber protein [Caudoviricetes sp.]